MCSAHHKICIETRYTRFPCLLSHAPIIITPLHSARGQWWKWRGLHFCRRISSLLRELPFLHGASGPPGPFLRRPGVLLETPGVAHVPEYHGTLGFSRGHCHKLCDSVCRGQSGQHHLVSKDWRLRQSTIITQHSISTATLLWPTHRNTLLLYEVTEHQSHKNNLSFIFYIIITIMYVFINTQLQQKHEWQTTLYAKITSEMKGGGQSVISPQSAITTYLSGFPPYCINGISIIIK